MSDTYSAKITKEKWSRRKTTQTNALRKIKIVLQLGYFVNQTKYNLEGMKTWNVMINSNIRLLCMYFAELQLLA